jgi:aminopeptidase N
MILDEINPQVAARLLAPLGQWRRFDDQRQLAMRDQLCQILEKQDLSPDVYEIASKALD